jgi:ADP-ribose pyrophosphatase YjhB (NUDIX family)
MTNREYPQKPIASVGAIVWRGESVLLVKRGRAPNQGRWMLPGGAQELGETVHESLMREVLEETGIVIEVEDLVGVVDAIHRDPAGRVQYHYTILDYAAAWRSGEPKASDDAAQACFVPMDEIGKFDLTPQTVQMIAESHRRRLTLSRPDKS